MHLTISEPIQFRAPPFRVVTPFMQDTDAINYKDHYKIDHSFQSVIRDGLQNKPKLISFTFVGRLDAQLFFDLYDDDADLYPYEFRSQEDIEAEKDAHNLGDWAQARELKHKNRTGSYRKKPSPQDVIGNVPPDKFLALPHLQFLSNITEFTVTCSVQPNEAGRGWGAYFKNYFLTFKSFPKLNKIQYLNEKLDEEWSEEKPSEIITRQTEEKKSAFYPAGSKRPPNNQDQEEDQGPPAKK